MERRTFGEVEVKIKVRGPPNAAVVDMSLLPPQLETLVSF